MGVDQGNPSCPESAIAAESAQPPAESKETSTTEGSPVRSRFTSAAAIPPAIVMPPIESPHAGPGCERIPSSSTGVALAALPARHQNAVMS